MSEGLRERAVTVDAVTDLPSFRTFFREHHRAVVGLVVSLTGDVASAEDVAQEAFTRAFRDWDRIGAYDDPGAWVRRVASNLAVSRWRRLRAEATARVRLGRPTEAQEPALPDGSDEVWREVRRLPHRQAVAVHLFYVEDRDVASIAEVLGCSQGNARTLLYRARRTLADRLGEEWR